MNHIRKPIRERRQQEQQTACQLALSLQKRVIEEMGSLFLHGATADDIQKAQIRLAELLRDMAPAAAKPHVASLWSTHRCINDVYKDMTERVRTLPPPAPPEPYAVTIGVDTKTDIPVKLPTPARMRGTYVVGLNGTGKSTLLLEMIAQDMQEGHGICLLDPHGDLTNAVLDRVPTGREDDVIVLDLAVDAKAWGLNLFACPDPSSPREVTRTVDHVLQAFGKIWGNDLAGTPGLADMLRTITITLVSNPKTTMADIQRLLTDDGFRDKLVANVQDTVVREFWEHEYNRLTPSGKQQMRASLLRRIRALLTPLLYTIVSQPTNSVDFRRVMDEGKILLVQLDAELADVTSMLGTVIVGQLLQAALSRKDVERHDRRPFFLYADEYHRFATPFFGTLIQEARKYNIATVMAHQARYQLRALGEEISKVPLSVPNIVVFQVTAEDATELVRRFTQPLDVWHLSHAEWQRGLITDLVNMPLYTAYRKTGDGEGRMRIPHQPVPANLEKRERLRTLSRERYYRPVGGEPPTPASLHNDAPDTPPPPKRPRGKRTL